MSYNFFNLSNYRPETNNIYPQSSLSKYSDGDNCPTNETPESFKEKTGKTCYEPCPPGKERNSNDICVHHEVKERKKNKKMEIV